MAADSMDANARLAALLGWTEIFDVGGALLGRPPGGSPQSRDQARIPNWTGDWRDCGPLMVEYVRQLRMWPHRGVVATRSNGCDLVRNRGKDDREESTRRLIVDAVIAELEARQ